MAAPIFKDRVKETSTTTGTGTLTLGGAATGYQAFSAVGNGARCRFCTTDGTNWEIAEGIYTLSGTTLTRATIIASSNSGSAVSWSAGSKDVFLVADATFVSGMPTISASTSAPSNPRDNDLWFKTDEGSLKIYFNDGDSSQWIDIVAGQPLLGWSPLKSSGLSVPASSAFTAINSPTLTNKTDRLQVALPASGTNLRALSLAVPSAPYTLDGAFTLNINAGSTGGGYAGLFVGNGTAFRTFYAGVGNNISYGRVGSFTNSTTFSTYVSSNVIWFDPLMVFVRITDDGATRKFLMSNNGKDFVQMYSEAAGTFVTPTTCGMAFWVDTNDSVVSVLHWLISGSVLGDAA